MTVHKVCQYPEPVLLKRTEEVRQIGQKEKNLVRDMIETMHATMGVGLSANQIGYSLRIFVACPTCRKGQEMIFFNPRIVQRSGRIREDEGCLSVVGYQKKVTRYRKVRISAENMNGEKIETEGDGLLARIFQHEIDHLDGKLYIHRLGYLERKSMLRKLNKA